MGALVGLIISDALSGDKIKRMEARKSVEKLLNKHYSEPLPRNGEATVLLRELRDEFIKLSESIDSSDRLVGIQGLGWISISDVFDEKIDYFIELIFETIVDDKGDIRLATANAFGYLRAGFGQNHYFTDEKYVRLYLDLIELLDNQTDEKKKKSIENMLGKLYCPHLDTILRKMGYAPSKQKL